MQMSGWILYIVHADIRLWNTVKTSHSCLIYVTLDDTPSKMGRRFWCGRNTGENQYDQLTSGMRCVGGRAACKCPFLSDSSCISGAEGATAPASGWPRCNGVQRGGINELLTSVWAGTA